ncbi:ATP synthase (F/14-kDa) subunit domain-containing protein [Phthorimaea operculella]|nr:ATP synthase (F/14-kDa) subunit domain-containing protein [Phthorimaea operculella]
MALAAAVKGKLISVIGDEDTCVGFLLGGIGEINKNRHPNFMVVDKNTPNVAELIRHVIDAHTSPVPAVLEIPSKDHPYDASKDSILRRAKGMFNPEDMTPFGSDNFN